jgi:hypothetical protein
MKDDDVLILGNVIQTINNIHAMSKKTVPNIFPDGGVTFKFLDLDNDMCLHSINMHLHGAIK